MSEKNQCGNAGRWCGSVLLILGSVLWLEAAQAQESARGSLFPGGVSAGPSSSGSASGGETSGFPRDAFGDLAPQSGTANGLPVELLRAPAARESRKVPADPLRGLIVAPDPVAGRPAAEGRSASQGDRGRHQGSGSNRSSSSRAPADPLKGLVNDSDNLLKFSDPASAAVPEAAARSGGGADSLRRSSASPRGMAMPDLSSGISTTYSQPSQSSPSLPKSVLPFATSGSSDLGLDMRGSFGPEQKVGPAPRTPASYGGGGGGGDRSPSPVRPQYTLAERFQQLLLGTVQQPLSYVLLLGVLGFIVAVKFRRS